MDNKPSLPIVAHELVGGIECCGCLVVVEREGRADLTCNECFAVVKTVAPADVERELLAMAMNQGVCSARCSHCGEVNVFPGVRSIEAFVCRECAEGNAVTAAVQ